MHKGETGKQRGRKQQCSVSFDEPCQVFQAVVELRLRTRVELSIGRAKSVVIKAANDSLKGPTRNFIQFRGSPGKLAYIVVSHSTVSHILITFGGWSVSRVRSAYLNMHYHRMYYSINTPIRRWLRWSIVFFFTSGKFGNLLREGKFEEDRKKFDVVAWIRNVPPINASVNRDIRFALITRGDPYFDCLIDRAWLIIISCRAQHSRFHSWNAFPPRLLTAHRSVHT